MVAAGRLVVPNFYMQIRDVICLYGGTVCAVSASRVAIIEKCSVMFMAYANDSCRRINGLFSGINIKID